MDWSGYVVSLPSSWFSCSTDSRRPTAEARRTRSDVKPWRSPKTRPQLNPPTTPEIFCHFLLSPLRMSWPNRAEPKHVRRLTDSKLLYYTLWGRCQEKSAHQSACRVRERERGRERVSERYFRGAGWMTKACAQIQATESEFQVVGFISTSSAFNHLNTKLIPSQRTKKSVVKNLAGSTWDSRRTSHDLQRAVAVLLDVV